MKQERTFTIIHGLVASIAVHAMIGLPFVMSVLAAPPDDPPLLIELQGAADSPDLAEVKPSELAQKSADQQEARPQTQAKETPPAQTAPSDEPALEGPAPEQVSQDPPQPTATPPSPAIEAPPPTPESKAAPDDSNVKGANQYVPPTRTVVAPEITDREYSALLMKKIRNNLAYPDEAKRARLQGVTTVSFVILSDGRVQPGTLKIVKSSGQPALDAGALSTIRASAPFAPPPREMAVSIGVWFGPKR